MTISYNWLSEYLPEALEPEKLSKILTAVGLEVESMEAFENIKGGLKGLVVGEVLECSQHPNADKLKLTKVNIGTGEPLKIVCGANNVASGQKVIVAPVGATIFPTNGEPVTMKVAKIRGEESHGMICAEDEIGLGTNHAGIIELPSDVKPGTLAADYYNIYRDTIYEIGLTPNRMDAMSHFGVAKDVTAYLCHHYKKDYRPITPFKNNFKNTPSATPVKVSIENQQDCRRYAGTTITGVTVKESPDWLKNRLEAIGQRPINNIVDITNFILHETGQPLHAFDLSAIEGGEIIVGNLAEGTLFKTLDDKERKLTSKDLMICNAKDGMCIAGVFGGSTSGVKNTTTSLFLESAWFNPVSIRKTSFYHQLRTEAASRFEKGVDISNVVNVLKRASTLIIEIAGGEIHDLIDVYPQPWDKTEVSIKYHYLKKLSGKNYHPDTIKKILTSLGYEVMKEGIDELRVSVPFSKPDITLPADIVEEILRIDGLDNIDFPGAITINPSVDENNGKESAREKVAGYLTGVGFSEMLTNSITNSAYFTEDELKDTVKMINNLSAELDVLRPSMLETGLETIAYNINRRNNDLQLFEFGKPYHTTGVGNYNEQFKLALYLTGKASNDNWKQKGTAADFYRAKGLANSLVQLLGLPSVSFEKAATGKFPLSVDAIFNGKKLLSINEVAKNQLQKFDIKQPVFFIDIDWTTVITGAENKQIKYAEVSRFPSVQRDLALVVDKNVSFDLIKKAVSKAGNARIKKVQLFDIFESDKLGEGKKSMAVSFTFLDEEKTMTDKEIDAMVNKIIANCEKEVGAEIRK